MRPSRCEIVGRLAAELPAAGISVHIVGSYGRLPLRFEEIDIVLLAEESISEAAGALAGAAHRAFADWPVALQVCSAFVPRSYVLPLTVHVAMYDAETLLTRRPRLITALVQQPPDWGRCRFLGRLAEVEWSASELLFERWGLIHSLVTLAQGGWEVQRWCADGGLEKVPYDLANATNLLEFFWYSASKLSANLEPYLAGEGGAELLVERLRARLNPLSEAIVRARRGEPPEVLASIVRPQWFAWLDTFQEAFASCPGTAVIRAQASASSSSVAADNASEGAPSHSATKLNPKQARKSSP